MQVCPGCGESSPDRFSECAFCGAPLSERRETREDRKVLTVVFCDLKDSTALGESLDPEALGEVLDLYFTTTTRVLRRHGGAIQKFIGDAVVAAFGLPVVHEDDALRAVRAAVEMREGIRYLNQQLSRGYGIELEARIGVHTGVVVVRMAVNDQQVLSGDTLNTAARLEQAAGGGEILMGEPTYRLVRDAIEAESLEPLELKGKAERVPAFRLLRVFGDEQSSRRHDAPMVGREKERQALRTAFERATMERRCHLVTVFGEAGVGKSRLVRSLVDDAAAVARVVRGRCLPYGEGITFWPLLSIVRDACDIPVEASSDDASSALAARAADPEVARRVASALGWSDEQLPVAELFWGVRELFEGLTRGQPLMVVIDDVHWAAPTLLGLIEHLVETAENAPILLVCTARPDMVEERPEWSLGARSERIVLDRLPDDASAQVIDNLMEGVSLPPDLRRMIIEAAEGNPLFVEQLVSMLIDGGVLAEGPEGWRATRSIDRLEIPPSINALLTARLDMLTADEWAVIEPASVIGLEFPSTAVAELVTSGSADIDSRLMDVERKQLVRRTSEARELADHRFHHILIRDAAYQRTLKRSRAALHEGFAEWLLRLEATQPRSGEHDEIIGYHLEQAHALRSDLGPMDPHATTLGERAAERLADAGRRAFTRGDLPATINLLERAVAVLPREHAERLALLPDLAEAVMETGDFERATEILAESRRHSVEGEHPEIARAGLIGLMVDVYAGAEEGWADRVMAVTERALPLFRQHAHHLGAATAWRLRYGVDGSGMQFERAVAAAEQIVREAEAAGDARQRRRGAVAYAQAALHGPTPVPEAIRRCQELLPTVEGDRRSQAVVQLCLAQLVAMDGDIDRARELYRSAQDMLRELGPGVLASSTSTDAGPVEILAGDLDAAAGLLERDLGELRAFGETYLRCIVAGLLARVYLAQERGAEAETVALEAREIAAPDDLAGQVWWRAVVGLCRVAQGRLLEAIDLLDEAVDLTGATTAPLQTAQILVDRAGALAAAGRATQAERDRARAASLYRAKGLKAVPTTTSP